MIVFLPMNLRIGAARIRSEGRGFKKHGVLAHFLLAYFWMVKICGSISIICVIIQMQSVLENLIYLGLVNEQAPEGISCLCMDAVQSNPSSFCLAFDILSYGFVAYGAAADEGMLDEQQSILRLKSQVVRA
jgi:hypothetical protein